MAINFPNSPLLGQTHVVGTTTYEWDGAKWIAVAAPSNLGSAALVDTGTGPTNVPLNSQLGTAATATVGHTTGNVVPAGGANGALTVGTNDATALTLKTNNTARMAISSEGIITASSNGTATDTTSNRLLKVGDFGLGVRGVEPTDEDLNLTVNPGFYRLPASVTNAFPGKLSGDSLIVASFNTTYAGQIGMGRIGTVWSRYNNNGVWTTWQEIYHQGSILGTVSQSAGVPTGAVIERGSNANGEYVRFADGTQICTRSVLIDQTTAGRYFFTWAAPFADQPAAALRFISTSVQARIDRFGSISCGATPTSFVGYVATDSVASEAYEHQALGVGRWF